ncbi:hypothetical protein HK096_008419 [Nowakowskiella sp. JEL0078]|nr:hypothetical protein HK096_008419 [Nowakowskiella sp. JEL0078]
MQPGFPSKSPVLEPSPPPPINTDVFSNTDSKFINKLPGSPILFPSVIPIPLELPKTFEFGILDKPAASEAEERQKWETRSQHVVASFRHAWNGYTRYAWKSDELHPISQRGSEWFQLGLTAIDALDTAWIMGQRDIFEKAKSWVASGLEFKADVNANIFEITIRVMGGLLTSYHFSKEKLFLDKAIELAEKMMPAFTDSPSKIPLASINFSKKHGVQSHFNSGASSTAEVTTLQLEYKFLSLLSGNPKYTQLVEEISNIVEQASGKKDGLVPIFISPETGKFIGDEIRLGSRGDSYYEYLGKQWLFTNKTEGKFLDQHNEAVSGIKKNLLGRSINGFVFVGESTVSSNSLSSKMDHLVCFLPAVLAITATGGARVPLDPAARSKVLTKTQLEDLALAEDLARSCYEMYKQSPVGLSSEIVFWKQAEGAAGEWTASTTPSKNDDDGTQPVKKDHMVDFDIHSLDGHNLLRPETVESLFTLYRVTGDRKYRVWGWRIFRAFETWTRVESGGYTGLDDVRKIPPPARDKMETFFLGETLKYLFLLFAHEDVVPVDEYVFNTEAHPFPVLGPIKPIH